MKISFDRKRFQFYLWIGLAYVVLGILIDLSSEPGTFPARVLNNLWRGCYITVINFFFFEYTLPFTRARKKLFSRILVFLLAFWLLLMLYAFGTYAWRNIGIQLHFYTGLKTFSSVLDGVTYGFPFAFFSILFFGVIKHFHDHNRLKQEAQRLLIEKQEAELNYLKSQTNPHFLFNTLNNIYSLAKDKSDLAPESIVRLSEILRFMLYETGGEYIALEQEVKVISDYIALEQLRYDSSLRVSFHHDIEDMKQAVPPLLLIPLVENAFKHGASETSSRPFVDIHLSVKKRQLTFIVENSIETPPEERGTQERIGLSNLRRQLELLYSTFELSLQHTESLFTATLTIDLASHV